MNNIIRAIFVCAIVIAAFFTAAAEAQSHSVGVGKITYQILFSEWANPDGKIWTGGNCDAIGFRCDTRFVGYADVFADNEQRTPTYVWPGPNGNEYKWPLIGQSQYEDQNLRNFAYLNLTGVELNGFREAILRVKVLDVDLLSNDEIGSYIGLIPGLRDLNVARYEEDAQFSTQIALEPLSTVISEARKGQIPDRNTVQQQHLYVRVRAWGADSARLPTTNRLKATSNTNSNSKSNQVGIYKLDN